MSGQGTIKSGRQGQTGTVVVNTTASGQPTSQKNTEQSIAIPNTSKYSDVTTGSVIDFGYNDSNSPAITADGTGNQAKGNVDNDGRKMCITDAGGTSLPVASSDRDYNVDIDLSGTYGGNSGYGGRTGIYCSDVKGKAGYLGTSPIG